MKKSFLYSGIIAVTILAIGTGILAYANAPKTKTFTGINGNEITVYSDNFSATNATRNDADRENVKAGDIIEGDVGKEIIIGVSDDGQFITMPLAEYKAETNP